MVLGSLARYVSLSCGNCGATSSRALISIVVLVLFIVFVLQNAAVVDMRFFFWEVRMSRVLILLMSLCAGVAVGLLIGWELFRKKKR